MKIIAKGVGSQPGRIDLHLSEAHTISSMSRDFMAATMSTKRFGDARWEGKIEVELMTLDSAFAEFGTPTFIKIDVEGYEFQVLRGMSRPVPALSFEFTPECFSASEDCIWRLAEIGPYKFQLSYGENLEWELPEWTTAEALIAALARTPKEVFGDIYARLQI